MVLRCAYSCVPQPGLFMARVTAANGSGHHKAEVQLPPEFESRFRLCLTQEDSEGAVEALRRGLLAKKSQRVTVMVPKTHEGLPILNALDEPILEPQDAYEMLDDTLSQIRAAELILAYAHGFPVKRSASVEAKGFISLDNMLADSPAFAQLQSAHPEGATVKGRKNGRDGT